MPRHSESTLAAIKHAVDIVALVGEYLPLHRAGSKFKALCPFHDDHNPSLELNPERQSFKCWSCGAGGDVFDFVMGFDRVEFPEALRMLADRAGVALENPSAGSDAQGPSKAELLALNAWAERTFAEALVRSPEAQAYVADRGIVAASVARFQLGYAPEGRDWLLTRARRQGYRTELLERVGLVTRAAESPGVVRERFRGRLMFPIHDLRGRTLGFGGRVLPQVERALAAEGRHVAKYLNSPETALFQKRRVLYAADLARAAAREAGWVAVVEGYTDVIAAHQVGLCNVVGTLGTALGDEHVRALRRLADRVVLVFDGDEAGQAAADRALELFLGHEVDVRVLTLPPNLDPCDFLLKEGAAGLRARLEHAVDPLAFAIERAEARFDLEAPEDARRAADWVLAILARIPTTHRAGLDVKLAKALDLLSERLRVPVETLGRRLRELQRPARRAAVRDRAGAEEGSPAPAPIRPAELDPIDLELVQIVLNEPSAVGRLVSRVAVTALRDAPLRIILKACYELHADGREPTFEQVTSRLEDPAIRALAAGLLMPGAAAPGNRHPIDPQPMPEDVRPAPWERRLADALVKYEEREWQDRLKDLQAALDECDATANPDEHRALMNELFRIYQQRPDTRKKSAS